MGLTLSEITNMQASLRLLAGIVMLVVSTDGQQMCLESSRRQSDYSLEADSPVIFDHISTMGTSTIEESLVDVSLANTTGEIKIKNAYPYFYLVVKASQKPQYNSIQYNRNARLFLLVNGKVPLRGSVWISKYNPHNGRLESEESLRVVGIPTENPTTKNLNPKMPLGMIDFSTEEVTFEAMEFLHAEDTLRLVTDSMANSIGHVSVCIFYDDKGNSKGRG